MLMLNYTPGLNLVTQKFTGTSSRLTMVNDDLATPIYEYDSLSHASAPSRWFFNFVSESQSYKWVTSSWQECGHMTISLDYCLIETITDSPPLNIFFRELMRYPDGGVQWTQDYGTTFNLNEVGIWKHFSYTDNVDKKRPLKQISIASTAQCKFQIRNVKIEISDSETTYSVHPIFATTTINDTLSDSITI